MITCSHGSQAVRTRWSWRGDTHGRYFTCILATAIELLELVLLMSLINVSKNVSLTIWSFKFLFWKREQGCILLVLSKLDGDFYSCSHEMQTCHVVSGLFIVIPSWIVSMHAEEEIKNQMVDSCRHKDWHAAVSLRNSSLSFLRAYLPCAAALSGTPTCHVTSSCHTQTLPLV